MRSEAGRQQEDRAGGVPVAKNKKNGLLRRAAQGRAMQVGSAHRAVIP